jgi:flagellar hook assembly protein FlgD
VDGNEAPGGRSVVWDGKDERAAPVASGVYYYRLEALGYEKTLKMIAAK